MQKYLSLLLIMTSFISCSLKNTNYLNSNNFEKPILKDEDYKGAKLLLYMRQYTLLYNNKKSKFLKSNYKINGPRFIKTKNNKPIITKKEKYSNNYIYRIIDKKIKKNNEEKPHSCETCGKKYFYKSSLNYHKRQHTGNLPFECKFCFKRYGCSSKLKMHLLSHSNKKGFKCNKCPAAFKTKYLLKRHKEIHSKTPNYKCRICKDKFKLRREIVSHLKNDHKIFERYIKKYKKLKK